MISHFKIRIKPVNATFSPALLCELRSPSKTSRSEGPNIIPGSNQRRRNKAEEARQGLRKILAHIPKAKKEALKQLSKDDKRMKEEEDEEADAGKVHSLRVCSTYGR